MPNLPLPHSDRIASLEKLVSALVKENEKMAKRQLGYESEDFKRKKDIAAIKKKLRTNGIR
jgi:hypothetical protein